MIEHITNIKEFIDVQANAYAAGCYGRDSFEAKKPQGDKVIRCKDCFYWTDEDFCNNPQWHDDDGKKIGTRPCTFPEDYCSYALPKDDKDE